MRVEKRKDNAKVYISKNKKEEEIEKMVRKLEMKKKEVINLIRETEKRKREREKKGEYKKILRNLMNKQIIQ